MVLDFLFKKKKPAAPAASQSAGETKTEKGKESIEARIEREMGSLPSFIKNKVKDPSVKQRFIELAKRMEKDGVDMNSPRAMKKWVKEHEKQIKEERQGGKVAPVVKEEGPGRNEPCPCGSGKKYKKCCGK
ncbi:MAG: SEC-C domain-containing protein [Elusimicrobiota bacterium]|jgi:uncharacterized protein YchJ|nr:SEC-C domain-containing protein [Elusimicrobiota bacterium]